jgi:type VI secretion system protein ImpJ
MKPIQRVVWSEGMLVAPQHMQQQDLYHERLLDERIAALSPYRWGVVSVEIDAGALGSGQLRVTRFVGVLPDGLYLSFEGKDPESPPTRPLAEHFPPAQAICEVFLGVQKEREGVPSISVDEGQAGGTGSSTKAARARFRASTRPVADLTGNAAELSMSFGRRNVVVLFGDEPRDDYDVIKIAELIRDGTGAFLNGEAYIPPVLRVDASPFLMAGIRRLLALMVAKQRQLAGNRNQRGGASIEFNSGDVTRFLQLSTVNGGIPILAYAAANGEISPTQLYLAVIQVVGQLATFSPDVEPWSLPAFAHTDLRGTFEELFARATGLLRTTVREGFVNVPLELNQSVYMGKIDDERIATATHLLLAVRSEMPEDQLAQKLPGLCKIASQAQLPQVLRSAATPGVPVQITHRPPSEIAIRAGLTYFQLNLQSEYWQNIVQTKTLAIYLAPPFDPARVKIELLAVPRSI